MLKHYVTFYYPGAFLSEESAQETAVRDTTEIDVPEGAFAFEFFDREEVELGGEVLRGPAKNKSPRYYPSARVLDVAQVLYEEPDNRILVANMETNNWPQVVRTRVGNYQPLRDGDVVYA